MPRVINYTHWASPTALNAIFLPSAPQSRIIDAKDLRRLLQGRHGGEHPADVLLLDSIDGDEISEFQHGFLRREAARQVLHVDAVASAQDGRTFDDIAQFAHVAGLGVAPQGQLRLGGEANHRLHAFEHHQEPGRQREDVVSALPERRKVDLDDIEAIQQILTETPCRHR